jgi:putative redox protein
MAAGEDDAGKWVRMSIDRSHYRTVMHVRAHAVILDEPVGLGEDSGPTPYELLLGALGGCTAMTLRMYADRKGWPLEAAHVRMRTASEHGADCEVCETDEVGPHHIERQIELVGPLTDDQRKRLLLIAERCPVKQALEHGIHIIEES